MIGATIMMVACLLTSTFMSRYRKSLRHTMICPPEQKPDLVFIPTEDKDTINVVGLAYDKVDD